MVKKILSLLLIAAVFAWNCLVYIPQVRAEETISPSPESTITVTEMQPSTQPDPPSESTNPSASPTPDPSQTQEQVLFPEQAEISLSPTPTPQIDNNAQVSNDIDSNANTGDNTIIYPSPTPTPVQTAGDSVLSSSASPTPTPDEQSFDIPTPTPIPELLFTPNQPPDQDFSSETGNFSPALSPTPDTEGITNNADIKNTTSSSANTGDNLIDNISSTPIPLPENSQDQPSCDFSHPDNFSYHVQPSDIQTGDASSVVAVDNSVNTTSVNSNIIYQTINIFNTQNGPLDLTTPYAIMNDVLNNNDKKNEPIVNVAVVSINNYAYLSNAVISTANTGGNSVTTSGSAVIDTGNAYSVVTLLNKVNVTLIDSTIHFITINVFGELDGNIILPDLAQTVNCSSGCGVTGSASNSATIANTVDSQATSGENTATVKKNADITTGDSTSIVNVNDLVNTTLSGVVFYNLNIQTFGEWLGQFLGWDIFGPSSDSNIALTGATDSSGLSGSGETDVTNSAVVSNNVSSNAITGNNNAQGKKVSITTGNAYSIVSIFNMVNTTAYNAVGFFGFINIFGKWVGDIGGQSEFQSQSANTDPDGNNNNDSNQGTQTSSTTNDSGSQQQEEGGMLEVLQTNNVGEYVLPGDTVTFFITVKNPGTGKVYNSKLSLYLLKDGVNMGGATFDLGDIPGGRGVKVTTGLVLSLSAPAGEYIARAYVAGSVGKDNNEVSATSDSTFMIEGATILTANISGENKPSLSPSAILAIKNQIKPPPKNTSAKLLSLLSILSIGAYLGIMIIRRRSQPAFSIKQISMSK